MAKQEWGTKRTCPKCSAKFYDLQKNPAECPSCQHSFDPEALVKKRPKRRAARSLEDVKAAKVLAAAAAQRKKKEALDDDEQDMELPEFEDLDIIEDIDDLEEVEVISTKPVAGSGDEVNEEDFLEDDDVRLGAEIDDEEDEDDK